MRIVEAAARRKAALLEGFVLANLAFLVLDVFLAHSVNNFRNAAEWIPVAFSIAATLLLAVAMLRGGYTIRGTWPHRVGLVVGFGSIALGVAGVIYHLESQFFSQWTIRSLVYTAPFAAPLAYAGLGFLLLVNRMVPRETEEWNLWVVFFALGGFLGVFVLALCDHAQNGFFHAVEWWPVFSSALAAGFLAVALFDRSKAFVGFCLGVLALQAVGRCGRVLSARGGGRQRAVRQPVRELRARRAGVRAAAVRRPRTRGGDWAWACRPPRSALRGALNSDAPGC